MYTLRWFSGVFWLLVTLGAVDPVLDVLEVEGFPNGFFVVGELYGHRKGAVVDAAIYFLPREAAKLRDGFNGYKRIALEHERSCDLRIKTGFYIICAHIHIKAPLYQGLW